ncbi:MAG: hypothetical protein SWL02_09780 [Pseudomonadota bacterium]|nr:hypothetical protein [Pseudomonadota bacterium]
MSKGVNIELLKKVMNQIIQEPETWDQSEWHSECRTSHCFAGWCEVFMKKDRTHNRWLSGYDNAVSGLGITTGLADYMFSPHRTKSELYLTCKAIISGDMFDFDRAGYDSEGYNCEGYNRAGFDRAGNQLEYKLL